MPKIENIDDIRDIFNRVKTPIVGVGVSAFNRIGPSFFIPNYMIICLYNSKDLKLMERDVKVLSLEGVTGDFPDKKKNSATVLEHDAARSFLNSLPGKPSLVIYKVRNRIKKICRDNGWSIIGQEKTFLEDKILFRKIMESCGIPPLPGRVSRLSEIRYEELSEELGPDMVLQMPKRSGGKGTFFIKSGKDMESARERLRKEGDPEILITRFIKGPSPSITACVTRHGVACTRPQYQLLDIEDCMNPAMGSGVFCGHDWTSSHDIPQDIRERGIDYAVRIGSVLKRQGYRGIFGLDFVWDPENNGLYIVECNPRLLGSFPVLTMVQLANKEIPIIALHIMELLDLDYEISLERVNQGMQREKRGAQLILYNKYDFSARNTGELEPGIYELSKGRLVFKRPSYDLRDLETGEEFLITDGVPFKNRVFKPRDRIVKFVTLHRIIDRKTLKINAWASERVRAIYDALKMERC